MKKITDKEFEDLLAQNEMLRYAVSEYERIFRKNFCLSEEEIRDAIVEIVSSFDESLVLKLTDIFQQFVDNDIKEYDEETRRKFAQRTIKYITEIYKDDGKFIIDNFIGVMKQAKQLNIDPFKIAVKTNIKNATTKTFDKSLTALIETKYEDLMTGKSYRLFELDEVKNIFEQCTTLISSLNEKRVQNTLDLLAGFSYDSESQSYFISPKELIKKSYSILREPVKNLERNIKFLEENFIDEEHSRKDLVMRVAQSPSILLVSPKKITDFEEKLAENIFNIICDESYSDKTLADEDKLQLAVDEAKKYCYNLDNLLLIDSINKDGIENIAKTSEVLIKFLGADNALKCVTKPEILECDPSLLEVFLSCITLEEKKTNQDLRAFFIENTRKCMDYAEKDGDTKTGVLGMIRHNRDGEVADKDHLPKLDDLDEKALAGMTAFQKSEASEFIDNLQRSFKKVKQGDNLIQDKNQFSKNSMLKDNTIKYKMATLSAEDQRKLGRMLNKFHSQLYLNNKENFAPVSESQAFEEVSQTFNQEDKFLALLEKAHAYLDAMYGEGYCDRYYQFSTFKENYNQLIALDNKFREIIVELEETEKKRYEATKKMKRRVDSSEKEREQIIIDYTNDLMEILYKCIDIMNLTEKFLSDKKTQENSMVNEAYAISKKMFKGELISELFKDESSDTSKLIRKAFDSSSIFAVYLFRLVKQLKDSFPTYYSKIVSNYEIIDAFDQNAMLSSMLVANALANKIMLHEGLDKKENDFINTNLLQNQRNLSKSYKSMMRTVQTAKSARKKFKQNASLLIGEEEGHIVIEDVLNDGKSFMCFIDKDQFGIDFPRLTSITPNPDYSDEEQEIYKFSNNSLVSLLGLSIENLLTLIENNSASSDENGDDEKE